MVDVMAVPAIDEEVESLGFEGRFDDADDGDDWEGNGDDPDWEEDDDEWEEEEDDEWEEDDDWEEEDEWEEEDLDDADE